MFKVIDEMVESYMVGNAIVFLGAIALGCSWLLYSDLVFRLTMVADVLGLIAR